MESAVIIILLLLLVLVWLVLPICTLVTARRLAADIEELKTLVRIEGIGRKMEERPTEQEVHEEEVHTAAENVRQIPATPTVPSKIQEVPHARDDSQSSMEKVEEKRTAGTDCEQAALDLFWEKVEDWFCVRGTFAPKGTTREFAVATRWLVRVGLTMLIASVVYFVKLSVDRGWMGPEARVAATVFWGAVGVAGGSWLVKKTGYGLIGHAMAALGIVALYLGFGLGHCYFTPPVIALQGLAFASLVLVTVVAGIVAVMLKSSTIAVMGLIGGYLVPVIVGKGASNPLPTCIYLLSLNVGAFVVARLRRWSALDFLAATLAYVEVFVWCTACGSAVKGGVMALFGFLTLVHALYMTTVVWGSGTRGRAGNALAWTGLTLNAVTYLGWLGTTFSTAVSVEATGAVLLLLVTAYVCVAALAIRRGWMDQASIDILLGFALVYLAIVPLLLLSYPWCVVSWSLVAIAASEAESRTEQPILGILAGLLLVVAGAVGIFWIAPSAYLPKNPAESSYWLAFVLRLLRLWTLPAAVAIIGWRRRLTPLLTIAGVVAFVFLTGEAHLFGKAFLPSLKGGTVTMAWTLTAFGLLLGGILARLRTLRLTGLSLLGVAVVKLLVFDTAGLATPARVAVFALVGALMMVGAFLYMKFKGRFEAYENA